jgi:hypothetical protein
MLAVTSSRGHASLRCPRRYDRDRALDDSRSPARSRTGVRSVIFERGFVWYYEGRWILDGSRANHSSALSS